MGPRSVKHIAQPTYSSVTVFTRDPWVIAAAASEHAARTFSSNTVRLVASAFLFYHQQWSSSSILPRGV